MENDSTVSVIVPIYNKEKYLETCLDSIIKQTYDSIEVILIDDGSSDSSGSICDEYAQKDSRIVVIHKPNGGLSEARNYGLDYATGEYICFVDSDDCIDPSMIMDLLSSVKQERTLIAMCGIKMFGMREKEFVMTDSAVFDEHGFWSTYFSQSNLICAVAWNKLYHKSVWEDTRYPVGKIHEDEFVSAQLIHKAGHISYVNKPLYFYRIAGDSIMTAPYSEKRLDGIEALLNRFDFFVSIDFLQEAKKTISKMITYFLIAYFSLPDARHNLRYKRLKTDYRKHLYFIFKCTMDLPLLLNCLLFCFHEKVYIVTHMNRVRQIKF